MTMNTNIPSSIAKAGEDADKLIAALSAGNTATEEATAITDEPSGTDELANMNDGIDSGIESQSTTDAGSEVTPLADDKQQQPTPLEGTVEYWKSEAESWKQKWSVLSGKYNKEIEQQKHHFFALKPEFDQLKLKNNELEATVQELQLQLAEMPKEQPAQPESIFESPEMKERLAQISEVYGEDLANGMRMLIETGVNNASTAASERINDLSQKVDSVESEVKTTKHDATVTIQEQNAQAAHEARIEKLAQELTAIGIDFQKVDNDPSFHQWISKFDSETGMQRRNLMLSMLAGDEIKSVAGMYVQYIEQASNAITESNTTQEPATQEPQAQVQPTNFNEQVQVETKAPIGNEAPLQTPVWTSEAISQFYKDVATGTKYSREQAEQIEREIFAQTNGR